MSGATLAKAEEINSGDHPMGYYAKTQTEDNPEGSDPEKTQSRVKRSTAVNVPSDLSSTDKTLPRKDAVDIASYQSWMKQSDFNQMKAQGVKTIVVKLSEGTSYRNPYAKNQIAMARAAGMNVAVYHFAWFSDKNSNQAAANAGAKAEANYFATTAKSLGIPVGTAMILDVESCFPKWDWTLASKNFASQLNANGYRNTKYYTSQTWAVNGGLMEPRYLGAKNMWIAQYLSGKPSSSNLRNTAFGAWQYSSQMYFTNASSHKPVDVSIDYSNIFAVRNVAGGSVKPNPSKLNNVYRLYNRNSGEHFYTESVPEKDNLVRVGWSYEGIGWKASTTGVPVYRVYNPNAVGGDHYYTLNRYEAQHLVSIGWRWDNNGKPAFYSNGNKNLYVAYNPNAQSGSHNYTTSSYEQNHLLDIGWKFGATAWKVN